LGGFGGPEFCTLCATHCCWWHCGGDYGVARECEKERRNIQGRAPGEVYVQSVGRWHVTVLMRLAYRYRYALRHLQAAVQL